MIKQNTINKANAYADMVEAYIKVYAGISLSPKEEIERCRKVYQDNGFEDDFSKDHRSADAMGYTVASRQYKDGQEINLLVF